MSITKEELTTEEQYLEQVIQRIHEIITEDGLSIQDEKKVINEFKKFLWDTRTQMTDVEVTYHMNEINQSVSLSNKGIKRVYQLNKALDSPYFARIDFDRKDKVRNVYIGIAGVSKNAKSYVFDWRAPISSLFYNHEVGEASYEAPVGIITGNIILKRQFKIKSGEIIRCFDSDISIDDEVLQEILSSNSSEKMQHIVTTIQKEQNTIIRNIEDRYLIVQGVAGSGKTSVALHRIAYLLYQDKNLTSRDVLILSPNEVFSDYISEVLPDLGEENVSASTFSAFAKEFVKSPKRIESFPKFIERFYQQEDIDESDFEVTKFKLSDVYTNSIDEFLEGFINELSFKTPITIGLEEIDVHKYEDILKNKLRKLPLYDRIENISERICLEYSLPFSKYSTKIRTQLTKALGLDLEVKEIYNAFLDSQEFKRNFNYDIVVNPVEKDLKYEDLIGLLYLTFSLKDYPYISNIKHVVIDEAQDYSLTQLQLLKKMLPKASFTILGDVNQTINPYYKYETLEDMGRIFADSNYLELLKTYRSSEEIISFTNDILDINNVCSVRQDNEIPVTFKEATVDLKQEIITDINEMKSSGLNRIAIITKNYDEACEIFNLLKYDIEGLTIAGNKDIGQQVLIVPSYISKGLEFDGVILYTDPENQYKEHEKNLLYVACTRAQHQLIVYNQRKLVRGRR